MRRISANYRCNGDLRAKSLCTLRPAAFPCPRWPISQCQRSQQRWCGRPFATDSPGGLTRQYTKLLNTRPIATKMISAGVISAAGDGLCQLTEQTDTGRYQFDVWRTLRFFFSGFFVVAPAMHYWFGFLFRVFPGVSWAATLRKVALDQLFMAPIFNPVRR
eukprot:SAG31_NODE_3547_length_4135_cov_4.829534_1_plen_161_part_00